MSLVPVLPCLWATICGLFLVYFVLCYFAVFVIDLVGVLPAH